jgi:hypothetical protein
MHVTSRDACRWLALEPEKLLEECRQSRYQGSGPGGQKRNRVYSGVRVNHEASGLSAESCEGRESARNLNSALHRLRLALALAPRPAPGEPSPDADGIAALPFRAGCNPAHPDYPRGVLRALDALAFHRGRLAEAAAALGCTGSALTRFLRADKGVWLRAREIREAVGLPPLK